jgi:hypothetical protein
MSASRTLKDFPSDLNPRKYELYKLLQGPGDITVRCARAVRWLQENPSELESICVCVKGGSAAEILPMLALRTRQAAAQADAQAIVVLGPLFSPNFWRILLGWVDKYPAQMYVLWRDHQLVMLQDVAGSAQQGQLSSTSALQVAAGWSFKSLVQSLVRRAQCISEAVFGLDPALLLQMQRLDELQNLLQRESEQEWRKQQQLRLRQHCKQNVSVQTLLKLLLMQHAVS